MGKRLLSLVALSVFFALPPGAEAQLTPSPSDWRDIPIYQVFTDRFFDGDPSNNNAEGSFDPGSATGPSQTWNSGNVHGGDFAGVLEKLDYIQALGFRAVWISPVQVNRGGAHHGYHAKDFRAVAPHFGTEMALRALADALHARDMYLILDVVANHTGDFITSSTPGYPGFQNDPSSYVLQWRDADRPAAPFNDLTWYHNNGEIQNFGDSLQTTLGELAGLDDLDTENPVIVQELIDVFTWLIDATDCDGFRVDTVKHVDLQFWQTWCPAVHAHAAGQGKNRFFLYGETFDGSDFNVGKYTGSQLGGPFTFDSALYFPMHFTMRDVFAYGAPTSFISDRYSWLNFYDPAAREQLLYFLDNHDVSRFLSFGAANQEWPRLQTALDFITTTFGVPVIYQGTEQGFDGGGDPFDREDMWDGEWEYGPSLGDNFNMTHPLYKHVRRLLDIRSKYEALRGGVFTELDNSSGEGIYAYRRSGFSEDVVVVLNTAASSRTSGSLFTGWTLGTPVADLLDPSFSQNTGSSGVMLVTVPGRSGRILVRSATIVAETPAVDSQEPEHADTVRVSRPFIRLGFNRDMDHTSVESAFSVTPGVFGFFSWEGDSAAVFTPQIDLQDGVVYTVRVDASARDLAAKTMKASFETFFLASPDIQTGLPERLPPPPLLRVFPNPLTSKGNVEFRVEKAGRVKLELFDLRGRLVGIPVDRTVPEGVHEVALDFERALGSGVYFLRLKENGRVVGSTRVVLP